MNVPNVFDVNLPDWDLGFTPLGHAILSAAPSVVEELLNSGSDVKIMTKASRDAPAFHPLTLTVLTKDQNIAYKIAESLIAAEASCSTATDGSARTIFYHAVASGRTDFVSSFLRSDPNSNAALNFPALTCHPSAMYAVVVPVASGNYSMLALLLANGVQLNPPEDAIFQAKTI